METKTELVYRLLSDYNKEFRAQFVLAVFLPIAAAWAALVTKTSERKSNYDDVIYIILVITALVVVIMAIGNYYYCKNRHLLEVSRIILMGCQGKEVELIRLFDSRPVNQFPFTIGQKENWSIRTPSYGATESHVIWNCVELTVVQAASLERLLNSQ